MSRKATDLLAIGEDKNWAFWTDLNLEMNFPFKLNFRKSLEKNGTPGQLLALYTNHPQFVTENFLSISFSSLNFLNIWLNMSYFALKIKAEQHFNPAECWLINPYSWVTYISYPKICGNWNLDCTKIKTLVQFITNTIYCIAFFETFYCIYDCILITLRYCMTCLS